MELEGKDLARLRRAAERRQVVQEEARQDFVAVVEGLREKDYSLEAIAQALGITRQSLWEYLRRQ